MTIFEFNEQLCEIIAGEDGYYNYDKQEILDLAKEMKTSAEEYQNMLDCKDAAEVHELMNPAVCDVWLNTTISCDKQRKTTGNYTAPRTSTLLTALHGKTETP